MKPYKTFYQALPKLLANDLYLRMTEEDFIHEMRKMLYAAPIPDQFIRSVYWTLRKESS
jgi:hypothetical protein